MTGAMRRLRPLAVALAVAAVAAGGGAWAKDHGDGPPRAEGRWAAERGAAGGGWRSGPPPGRFEGRFAGRPPAEPRYGPRAEPPGYEERYAPRPYEPRPYGPPPYATPRRGGFLGPQGAPPIDDPGRYRLRAAPRGYHWVRVPGGMALVSQATGQVFDVVPY
jgi:hypothetical protein